MNKGLTGAIRLTMIFIVLLVSVFFFINFIKPTSACSSGCGTPKGTISGYKWNDSNGNGVKDSGENLLSGWNITIKSTVSSSSQLTNSSGYYSFTGLTNGTYTISETLQNGWYNTTNASYKVNIICGSSCPNVNVNFGNKEQSLCKSSEKLTDFLYESKPTYAYVDNSTSNVSYKLCNSTSVSVDTSDGKTHYVYMDWNPNDINISNYDSAAYFDLMLYHYEDSTLVKVQLKNQSGSWIDVCDPSEHSSFTWDTCDLKPYLNILKNVPNIELRAVVWESGICRGYEYISCAKLRIRLYTCQPLEYCGDDKVTGSEKCELPSTNDNSYCNQSTTVCLGSKIGQRDAFGNCDASCGCVYDSFEYSCVKNQCGAECGQNSDCQDKCVGNVRYYSGNCDLTSTCSCSYSTEDCSSKNGCYAYGTGCEDRNYFCAPGGCNYTFSNRNTDYYDNFTNYCSGDSIMSNRTLHDFGCDGTCKDHVIFVNNSLVQNCNGLDGWYNTTSTQWISNGQCTEKEQLQQEYRDYTCSAASCTYTVTNHQWIDTGKTRSKADGTACDDGLFCTVNDKCTAGVCGGSPRDCSSNNSIGIATCDNNPDNYHFTWDFRSAFVSQCNETTDQCTTGNDTITHACSVSSCGAQCDSIHSCNSKCIGDVRYFSGNCDLSSCNCSYSTEDCSSKNGCYAYGTGCEDRTYSCNPNNCTYTSSQHTDYNDSLVKYCSADTIKTHKQFHDFSCDESCLAHTSWVDDQLVQDCSIQNGWYNTTNTQWVSVSRCTEKEQLQQEYRNYTCNPDPTVNCSYTITNNQWIDTGNTRVNPVLEPLNPPNKTIGGPKSECAEGDWCEWKVTTLTPITLTCENSSVKWRYALDGDWKDWNTNDSPVTIYFPEESNHTLEAYCMDECGNSTGDIEKFKVEGKPFNITLNMKWNLISVPFVMLNNSISDVFKDIQSDIISVWTYDPGHTVCGQDWCLYDPNTGHDDIHQMLPGWGYWVLTNNNTNLLIGGSLFSPATTPPDKNIVHGWNLIGYWGTDGQTNYTGPFGNGKTAYCELYSLVPSTLDNEFTSLVTYWEPWNGDPSKAPTYQWKYLGTNSTMDPGAGYWLLTPQNGIYAFSTTCA